MVELSINPRAIRVLDLREPMPVVFVDFDLALSGVEEEFHGSVLLELGDLESVLAMTLDELVSEALAKVKGPPER